MAKVSVEQALAKAKSHIKKGETAQAQALYVTILNAFPNNKKAQKGQAALAKANQSGATQRPPQEAINRLASLFNQGQLAVVVQQAEALTKRHPNNFVIWSFLGGAHQGLRQAAEAAKAFIRVTELNPQYPEGHNNLGVVLQKLGKLEASVKSFQKALSLKPDYPEAYYNMGIALREQGKLNFAIIAHQKSLALDPTNWEAYGNMGLAFKDNGDWTEAVAAYEKALAINPNDAELFSNMGNALKDQGKLEEAIEAYNKSLAIKPDYADAYNNMGITLQDQDKLEEAIEAYKKALAIKPDYAEAYSNMGNALKDQGKLEEAIEAYNKALVIKPEYAEAYNNMGNALKDQGKLEEAIEAYHKALVIKPDYAEAHYNMGVTLQEQGKLEEAIEAYNKALAIKPDYESARVQKLHQKAHICDWNSMTADRTLIPELGTTNKHVDPFALLSLEDSPERHQIRSKIYSAAKFPQKLLPGQVKPSQKPKRIRLGYFSSDLKEHPVAYLMAKMLEQHDRDQFEVFGYSIHGNQQSDMRQRLLQSFDRFTDVRSMTDKTVALQARQDGIDIAIDLNGYTQYRRTGIFAYRAAPVQINYLGYPGTLGANFMDYIVADKFLIPQANQKYFNEQPLYLPHTYMPTDNTRELSQKPISRKDVRLPDDAFVFCCFNNNYKISPAEFDIWMRLLSKVEGSVLWLRKSNNVSHLNMKKEAKKRNVDPSRLVFADRVPMDEHLARQRLADLFVDTFAFNAHTTASEALWAGLPVVTKAGDGFAARVAGSLLNAIGLPELVTTTDQDYEALILELATNPAKLAQVKDKLATNRLSQPLF
ncbi:tetratricopeptide repeat protein, partial [Planktomarina temperata]|nr:tetratricopeptide repeat protein [Planktomarina temperata]